MRPGFIFFILFFVFLWVLPKDSFSQENTIKIKKADTLNQYNAKHQKHGFWVVYLDTMVSPCDSAKSFYYAYQYFDNGFAVYIYQSRSAKKRSIESTLKRGERGKPVLLEGNIKTYLKGQIEFDETFVNGKPVLMNGYRCNKLGDIVMHEIVNFAIPYKNERGTFYYEKYGEIKIEQCAYYRKLGTKYDLQNTVCRKKQ